MDKDTLIGIGAVAGIIVVVGGLGASIVRSGGRPAPDTDGETLYRTYCESCHKPEGQGIPGTFPPLAGSPRATGEPTAAARIVIRGLEGPIESQGVKYDGVMIGFGSRLSDEHVARLLTFVRSSWGNTAPPVSAADVKAAR